MRRIKRRNPRFIWPLAALSLVVMQAERRIRLKAKFGKLFSLLASVT